MSGRAPVVRRPARIGSLGEVRYLDDARAEPLHELCIWHDDQGDLYVQVLLETARSGPAVRLCASGGADAVAPGLRRGIALALRAIEAAATGKPHQLRDGPPVHALDITTRAAVCGRSLETIRDAGEGIVAGTGVEPTCEACAAGMPF